MTIMIYVKITLKNKGKMRNRTKDNRNKLIYTVHIAHARGLQWLQKDISFCTHITDKAFEK